MLPWLLPANAGARLLAPEGSARLIFERANSIKRFPLAEIYEACRGKQTEVAVSVYYPLLACLACDDPHKIAMALQSFLSANGVAKPSELTTFATEEAGQNVFSVFLLKVCTPEVLDSLLCMGSTADVETERIEILRKLMVLEPPWLQTLQSEILRITEAAELRKALHRIEESRVEVNIAGMREAEALRFREAFLRLAALRELLPDIKNIEFKPLGLVGDKSVYSLRREDFHRLIAASEGEARLFKIFTSAFEEVREVFLNSPQFGLDTCLSVRIRHGILAQHIQRPFYEQRLLLDPADKRPNGVVAYWTGQVQPSTEDHHVLLEILQNLTQAVLDASNEVKTRWLQVKTETRDKPGALFDYVYTGEQLQEMFLRRGFTTADYPAFLEGIFAELLGRTKKSLSAVRDHISQVLGPRLNEIIVHALQSITPLEHSPGTSCFEMPCRTAEMKCTLLCKQWIIGLRARTRP